MDDEELVRAAQEWQTTFDATNNVIWILDRKQRVMRCNKASERLFDRPRKELVGQHCWEIVHGTQGPIPECPLTRARRSLHREAMELPIGQGWFEVTVDPILDVDGGYAGAVHIISDITGRKRAEERMQELLDRQVAINELALALGETRDLDTVYRTIYRHVRELVDAEAFIVASYDRETDLIKADYVVSGGEERDVTVFPAIPLEEEGRGTQSRAIHSGEPFYARDWRRAAGEAASRYKIAEDGTVSEGIPPLDDEEAWEDSIHSAIYAPMKIKGQVVGVMQVQSHRLDAYTQEDIDLLAALANVSALAVQNSRLFNELLQSTEDLKRHREQLEEMVVERTEELERLVNKLSAFNAMAAIVTESLDVDKILDRTIDEVLQHVGVEAAAVLLLEQEAGELALAAHRGLSEVFVRTFSHMELGEGLAGRVAETGEPSILRNLTEYPEALRSYVEGEKIRSAASVPLIGRTGVIGVMNLGALSPAYFDAEGLDVLLGLGQQMALGVERARLYQEARESEERFRRLSRAASEGIIIHQQGRIVEVNHAFAAMYGYGMDELVGMDGYELIAPECRERVANYIASGYERAYETRMMRADGTIFPADVIGKAIPYGGRTLRVVVVRDITERKEMEERLMRQERLAVLGQLAGGVAHELRNPLGAIKNGAYFLNMALPERELDPEVQETLGILEREVNRSERIIGGLLDFACARPPVQHPVDLHEVVREVLAAAPNAPGVEVVCDLDEELPAAMADRDQLDLVFGNLIRNAIQAMPEGGRLTIRTFETSEVTGKLPKSGVIVSVADTGEGIPEEHLERIFEPLFSTKTQGIGLGLALTKRLVEAHGGSIEVESEVGVGSTFTVRLPGTAGGGAGERGEGERGGRGAGERGSGG